MTQCEVLSLCDKLLKHVTDSGAKSLCITGDRAGILTNVVFASNDADLTQDVMPYLLEKNDEHGDLSKEFTVVGTGASAGDSLPPYSDIEVSVPMQEGTTVAELLEPLLGAVGEEHLQEFLKRHPMASYRSPHQLLGVLASEFFGVADAVNKQAAPVALRKELLDVLTTAAYFYLLAKDPAVHQ